MSKSIIYNEIKTKLETDLTGLKHFDLWNNQIDNLDDETAFNFPALFLEWSELTFTDLSSGIQEIEGIITIYIVQKKLKLKGTKLDEMLDFVDSVANVLNGFNTDAITNPLKRIAERQDIEHDMLIVWEQDYALKGCDATSSKYNDGVDIPADTLSLDMPTIEEGDGLALVIQNDLIRTAKDFIEPVPPAGYQPTTDTDLVMWFDSSGLVANASNSYGDVDASNRVSRWNNLKGLANTDLLQAVTTAQPLLDAEGVKGDGVNDFLASVGLPTMNESQFTFVTAVEIITGSEDRIGFQGTAPDFVITSISPSVTSMLSRDSVTRVLTEGTAKTLNTTSIDFFHFDSAWDIVSNGNNSLSGSLTNDQFPNLNFFQLGKITGGTTTFRKFLVKEIFVFDKRITDSQKLSDINDYLLNKW